MTIECLKQGQAAILVFEEADCACEYSPQTRPETVRLLQHWRHQQLNGVKRFFYQIEKARKCSTRAKIILSAGIGEDVGRDAYLAAFHAAQA